MNSFQSKSIALPTLQLPMQKPEENKSSKKSLHSVRFDPAVVNSFETLQHSVIESQIDIQKLKRDYVQKFKQLQENYFLDETTSNKVLNELSEAFDIFYDKEDFSPNIDPERQALDVLRVWVPVEYKQEYSYLKNQINEALHSEFSSMDHTSQDVIDRIKNLVMKTVNKKCKKKFKLQFFNTFMSFYPEFAEKIDKLLDSDKIV